MNDPTAQQDVHLDVGCYVVDDLDVVEREAFEAHLAGCDNCRREVVEFTETTAELAELTATDPPAELRSSILDAIRTVRPLPPIIDDDAFVDGWDDTSADQQTDGDEEIEGRDDPEVGGSRANAVEIRTAVDELAARRSRSTSRRVRFLTVAVAAVAVLVVAFGAAVVSLNQQHQADVATQAAAQRESDLLAAPDARVITQTHGAARYRFVVSRQRNEALLIGSGLPDPGPGNVYQLWTLRGSRAAPDATMAADETSRWFTGPIADSTALAVTIEPNGGSPQPTTPILAQATI